VAIVENSGDRALALHYAHCHNSAHGRHVGNGKGHPANPRLAAESEEDERTISEAERKIALDLTKEARIGKDGRLYVVYR
jgi:hypothetical protein